MDLREFITEVRLQFPVFVAGAATSFYYNFVFFKRKVSANEGHQLIYHHQSEGLTYPAILVFSGVEISY